MYIILNAKLERIGTLDNQSRNGTHFWGDLITRKIADDDAEVSTDNVSSSFDRFDNSANTKFWGHSLESLSVRASDLDAGLLRQGNHLAYQDPDNHHWYVMRIISVRDSVNDAGVHYKTISATNLCIWKLKNTIQPSHRMLNANSCKAFNYLLADTGWYLDPHNIIVGGSHDIEFDGRTSSQSKLQELCQAYGAELDAWVEFDEAFRVALKRVEIYRQIGKDNGARATYGDNILSIERNIVDTSLYTRLYVYGANGISCAPANDGKPFVQDQVANMIYNPPIDGAGKTYLEGVISSDIISTPQALLTWGKRQLKLFNHPRANYNIQLGGNFQANLGDTVRILDLKMDPELTVEARVIERRLSFSDPTQNTAVVGEYTTVKVFPPDFINKLQTKISQHLAQILATLRSNPNALTCVIDKPTGITWAEGEKSKTFTAHISVMGEDITGYIQPQGFVWRYKDANGTLHPDFTAKHQRDGYQITVHPDVVGELSLLIDTRFIADTPKVSPDVLDAKKLFEIPKYTNTWGDTRHRATQYIQHDSVSGDYVTATRYDGSQATQTTKSGKWITDLEFARLDAKGQFKDSMIVRWGGHGGSFGLENANGTLYLWTGIYNYEAYHDGKIKPHVKGQPIPKPMGVARIPYQPNKVLTWDDKSIQKFAQSEDYFRTNYDANRDYVLMSKNNPAVDLVYERRDIEKSQLDAPLKVIERTDFKFTPKRDGKLFPQDKTSDRQTFQSGYLRWPFLFWTTGDANMSDPRYLYGVDLTTGTLMFQQVLDAALFGLENEPFFEPETIGVTEIDGKPVFLMSFNTANAKCPVYAIPYAVRDDKDIDTPINADDTPPAGTTEIRQEAPTDENQSGKH